VRRCSNWTRCGTNSSPPSRRVVTLLVERVVIGTDGLNVRLRIDGLAGLSREMLGGNIGEAA
jgi:hypothetical protein